MFAIMIQTSSALTTLAMQHQDDNPTTIIHACPRHYLAIEFVLTHDLRLCTMVKHHLSFTTIPKWYHLFVSCSQIRSLERK